MVLLVLDNLKPNNFLETMELGASRAKIILQVFLWCIEWKSGLYAPHCERAAACPTQGLYSCLPGEDIR